MILPIKSAAIQARLNKAMKTKHVEMPSQVFNKMCFGFVNNDWMTVISSAFKLSAFALLVFLTISLNPR